MEWDADCCIGFSVVDARREELFDTVRKLQRRMNPNKETVHFALKTAAQYASQVFPIEEELMREIFYPALMKHQEQHQNFKRVVSTFLAGLRNDEGEEMDEIVLFLNSWVEQHLLNSDIEFGQYKVEMSNQQAHHSLLEQVRELRQKPVDKILKLKHLFKEKLISIEDFKERKVKVFADYLRERGLSQLKAGIEDLEYFQKNDHLSEKEKKLVIIEFLEKIDLQKSLEDLNDIEEKLILLNSFFEMELVAEDVYIDIKDKVLSQI